MLREIRTCHRCLLALLGVLFLLGATGMKSPAPLPKDEAERQVLITIRSPLTVMAGNPVDVQVALTNGYGQAVTDVPVMLYLGEAWRQEVESDGQGLAYFRLLDALPAGDHLLLIKVKGKHGFRDSWTQSQLSVLAPPATPTSVVEPAEAKPIAVENPALVVQLTIVAVATAPPALPPLQVTVQPALPAPTVVAPVAAVSVISATAANATGPVALATAVPTIVMPVVTVVTVVASIMTPLPSSGLSLRDLGLGVFVGVLLTILLFMSNRFWQFLARIRPRFRLPTLTLPWHSTSNFHHLMMSHIRRAKWGLLCALASMVGSALMDLISPWPFKIIFDYILLGAPLPSSLAWLTQLTKGDTLTLLAVVAGVIVSIAILQSGFAYLENYMTTRAGYQLVNTLRRELFLHFQRLSLTFHQENKRGELVFNVADDAQTLRDAFTDSALSLVTQVLTIVGMFAVMFYVNWQLSLIPLLTFPLLFGVYHYLQNQLKTAVRKLRKKEGNLAAQLTENLSIMPMIQAFGREKHEVARFDVENDQNLESGVQIARLGAALNRTIAIISEVGLAAVIFAGAWLALRGQMTPGDVLIFITYVRTMYKPLRQMVKMSAKLNSAWVAAQRIAAVLDIEPTVQDKADAIPAYHLQGDIVFQQVAFQYKAGQPVLRDLSFQVRPGQRVALVGPSGAGKSTISNLLLRLYDPTQGVIRLDGVDLRDYQRESLRQQIGLVLQDALLFGATIRENICYGKPDATQAEVETAARQAHIHEFIAALPNGYDTVIGEMGSTLSGGQRQRIAIARALVKQPTILILDEPTSALDAESKALVEETINRLQRGKTVLVIAHHLASIQHFDKIIVMDQGCAVEQGTHAELLARRGLYADLHRLQQPAADRSPVTSIPSFLPALAGAD